MGTDSNIRPPVVGPSWPYPKRDLVTSELIDIETHVVSDLGQAIEIESHSETAMEMGSTDTENPYPF